MDSTRCLFGVVGTDADTVGTQQLVVVSVGGLEVPAWSESREMAFCRDCVKVGVFGVGGCCRDSQPPPSGWYSSCLRSIFNWFLFRNERRFVGGGGCDCCDAGNGRSSLDSTSKCIDGFKHISCIPMVKVSSTALADSESKEMDLRRALRMGEFLGASGRRTSGGERIPRVSVSLGVEQLDCN